MNIRTRGALGWEDDPDTREQLEGLARDKAYARIRKTLKAELSRKRLDLERSAEDGARVEVIAGEIKALRLAIGLPQQLYAAAGGKRVLFDEISDVEVSDG